MSLNQRVILSAGFVLAIFISLTAFTLEQAYVDSSETALRDTLTSQLYALMAVADVENKQVLMPSNELDALLGLPRSGIYAYITNQSGSILWQSSSTLNASPPAPITLSSGENHFAKLTTSAADYYTFAYGVNWSSEGNDIALTFNITTDLNSFNKQIKQYRQTLWLGLIAMASLLLISQALILRWGLSPLRKVGEELNRIETGKQEKIEDSYPKEIEQLSSNINLLLQQEREQKTRYRNALGDLAHSLKTPLAVIQSSLNNSDENVTLSQQVSRMNSIVEYQLQRAATAGSNRIGKPIHVKTIVNRMLESLRKVYFDKNIHVTINIDDSITFKGDEGDLMETLGNLLDNAFKWSNNTVEILAKNKGKKMCITINDDGNGIEKKRIDHLLQRGVRADQNVAGHGIGLSIVNNIVDAYQGELSIQKSELGGASVTVVL